MNFTALKNPGLPQSKVCHAAISDYSPQAVKKLIGLGIEPIITIPSQNLDKRVAFHTDMLVFGFAKGEVFLDISQIDNLVKFLTMGYSIKYIDDIVSSPYPNDSLLNAVMLKDKLLCNPKTVSEEVIGKAHKDNIKVLCTNQGYTKCSICLVNQNAIITDDESIYALANQNEIDCILVSKGSVKLDGFDYGFIGGCCGLIDADKLFFNGDINMHSDCNKITDFLSKHNVEPVIIENQPLTDIGGIIPLTELKHI